MDRKNPYVIIYIERYTQDWDLILSQNIFEIKKKNYEDH